MRVAALLAWTLLGCGRVSFDPRADASGGDAPGDAANPGIVDLSLRGGTACVRTGDGRMACWGSNANGELGRGSLAMTGAPELVPLDNVVAIATGEFSTYAIDRDGTLWAWGDNTSGQLGQAIGGPQRAPVRVPVPEPVVSAAAGQYHACAITRGAGELYCWGGNLCGGLGTNDVAERLMPTKVAGLAGLASVVVNDFETCVTDAAGNVRCFGGVYTDRCIGQHLAPTAPMGLPAVRDLQGGCHMSMCAVDATGIAWCWGQDNSGSLGDGAQQSHVDPLPVAQLVGARRIGTSFNASCAVTATGASCWGDNLVGQLGVGTPGLTQSTLPVPLPFFAGMQLDEIEIGCSTNCARAGADVYCWGANDNSVVDASGLDAFAPRKITLSL